MKIHNKSTFLESQRLTLSHKKIDLGVQLPINHFLPVRAAETVEKIKDLNR